MTDGLEYLGRARMQGLLLLVVTLLVGVLAGAALDRLLSRPRPPQPRPQEQREGQRLPRVLEDMDLTPAQHSAIDSILASGRPRNEAIMNQVLPQLRAVSDSLHQGIRAVLTPAQAAEFDAYLKSQRGRFAAPPPPREGTDGPRGGQPGEERRERRPPPREDFGGPRGGPPPNGAAPDNQRLDRRPPPRPDGNAPDRRPPPPPDGNPPPPPGGGP